MELWAELWKNSPGDLGGTLATLENFSGDPLKNRSDE